VKTTTVASLLACSTLFSIAVVVVACSSSSPGGGGSNPDAGNALDANGAKTLDEASASSPGSCTPAPGNTGNAENVGAFCTKNGGQCSTYTNTSIECSIDLSAQGSNFCVLIGCSQDTDCGEDACCTGQAGDPIHACVPNGCFDAGACPGIPQ
jgi:hypothetical protein